jgi:hypothetical protein
MAFEEARKDFDGGRGAFPEAREAVGARGARRREKTVATCRARACIAGVKKNSRVAEALKKRKVPETECDLSVIFS